MSELLKRFKGITENPGLSFTQKARYLSLEAENSLPYPELDEETAKALEERVICDMYEGHAPFKPRYVMPDYSVVLEKGSTFLELEPATTLDEAINSLMIAYHHVPSVTNMPVFIGRLDNLLLPYCDDVSDEDLYKKLKLFWRYLDRVLPDAFMHANVGPTDNRVARTIMRIDAELKQIAPNLTFIWDPDVSSDEIFSQACKSIIECSKPHIANNPLHQPLFDEYGYGVASCYNVLPLCGGASTLTRINLREVARRSKDTADFFENVLPKYIDLNFRLTEARIDHLFNKSGFFESFLVKEGWIRKDRFTAMYGIFAWHSAWRSCRPRKAVPANTVTMRQPTSLDTASPKCFSKLLKHAQWKIVGKARLCCIRKQASAMMTAVHRVFVFLMAASQIQSPTCRHWQNTMHSIHPVSQKS